MRLPHVVFDDVDALLFDASFAVVFGDRCVGQVLEHILGVCRVVILRCKAKVGRLPEPDRQGPDARDQDPLTNIELLAHDNQRPFDVLLSNPAAKRRDCQAAAQLIYIAVNLNVATTRHSSRLDDPEISFTNQAELFYANVVFEGVQ